MTTRMAALTPPHHINLQIRQVLWRVRSGATCDTAGQAREEELHLRDVDSDEENELLARKRDGCDGQVSAVNRPSEGGDTAVPDISSRG